MPEQTPLTTPWLTASQLPADLELEARAWLLDEGSLTRRLVQLSSEHFDVVPLREGWQTLRSDECQALGVPEATEGWVREVFLQGHRTPWVFARSVASRAALEGAGLDLNRLGSRSLGEWLFCEPAFTRHPIEWCRYPQDWLPAAVGEPGLWARRSLFVRDDLALLVAETFLPALWSAAQRGSE